MRCLQQRNGQVVNLYNVKLKITQLITLVLQSIEPLVLDS
ncbi:hypothetical protein VAE122_2980175 [Vibrio aestuarianus]|nr:hypothetical protein VAE122_2980175 [Vibrio aestuarianus]